MRRELKRLQAKHHVVLRLAFQGWSNTRIATEVGLRRETISRILHSALARAELACMQEEARELVVNVPLHTWLIDKVNRASTTAEALRLARQLRREKLAPVLRQSSRLTVMPSHPAD